MTTPGYAELHAHSAFSFLDGASQPEELVVEAVGRGLSALALTDHDGYYGVVRFAEAARGLGLPSIFGSELSLADQHLVVLARGPEGYRRLSRAIATAHLATGKKGEADYRLDELAEHAGGQWVVLTGCRQGAVRLALEPSPGVWDPAAARAELELLIEAFGRDNVAVEVTDRGAPLDAARSQVLVDLAHKAGVVAVATGNVHCASPRDQPLADTLAAVGARTSLDQLDGWLPPTANHIRSPLEMAHVHRR